MDKIYENIKDLRIQHGWTQEQLAQKVGYAEKSMISRVEKGKVNISSTLIMKFAEVFGIEPGELMGPVTYHEEISEHEMAVLNGYRKAEPAVQRVIDDILHIEKRELSSLSRKEA